MLRGTRHSRSDLCAENALVLFKTPENVTSLGYIDVAKAQAIREVVARTRPSRESYALVAQTRIESVTKRYKRSTFSLV